ncbi:hypothetical protein PCURB6_35260 [Paenibacillus curdlanolyticus]|nr:hypothetical protein PCURB6_35260 [Paenibacillus curdlanolyticus]
MPLWIEWLTEHWIGTILVLGVIVAILYVMTKRSSLFYKE